MLHLEVARNSIGDGYKIWSISIPFLCYQVTVFPLLASNIYIICNTHSPHPKITGKRQSWTFPEPAEQTTPYKRQGQNTRKPVAGENTGSCVQHEVTLFGIWIFTGSRFLWSCFHWYFLLLWKLAGRATPGFPDHCVPWYQCFLLGRACTWHWWSCQCLEGICDWFTHSSFTYVTDSQWGSNLQQKFLILIR